MQKEVDRRKNISKGEIVDYSYSNSFRNLNKAKSSLNIDIQNDSPSTFISSTKFNNILK